MTAPTCPACAQAARLTTGAEIYRNRPDLADKPIWFCDGCGAYVGVHPGTTNPLGTPAGPELRKARGHVHARLDAIWRDAWTLPCYAESAPRSRNPSKQRSERHKRNDITRAARVRVYAFLANCLGIATADCHVGHFDIETCRLAWRALSGVSYEEVRAWAHEKRQAEQAAPIAAE